LNKSSPNEDKKWQKILKIEDFLFVDGLNFQLDTIKTKCTVKKFKHNISLNKKKKKIIYKKK
jgi:hypothetical protein